MTTLPGRDPRGPGPPRPRALRARLLGIPLFYKILVANGVMVLVVSLLGTWLAFIVLRTGSDVGPLVALAVGGAVLSVAINAVIIQVALEPLRQLKRTADRIHAGDVDARIPGSPLADRDMEKLTAAVNHMLDRLGDSREQLREVAARALHAAEEERRRLSLELHDDISQRLAAILVRLRVARRVDDAAAKDAMLEEVRQEIMKAADGLRLYARGLRPPALDELGLGAAVESHARQVAETAGIAIEVRTEGVGRLDSAEAELALYRIVQEALANAVRHSGARRVRVEVERGNGSVVATVMDDGVGFDRAGLAGGGEGGARGQSRGLGLVGMEERAGYVGGRVEISSRQGEGTTVRASVPVEPGAQGSARSNPV